MHKKYKFIKLLQILFSVDMLYDFFIRWMIELDIYFQTYLICDIFFDSIFFFNILYTSR